MANLGPLYQNQTYSNLLQVDGGLTSELKPVLDGDGNVSGLTLSLTSVGISGLVAASASNLNAGLAGTVPYQIAPNTTGFTTVGTAGHVLTSTGAGAPVWTDTIQNSIYSSLAVDVAGGSAGQVVYQADANNTSFTGVGTLGQVLVSGGSGAPYWSTNVPAAGTAGSATNLLGGTAGNLPYQSGSGTTQFISNGSAGQLLKSQGSAAPVWATITAADVGSLPLNGSTAMTGNLSMGSHTITNLLNPVASTDAANKAYVDSVATGLKIKSACRVASTTNLVLSGLIAVDGVTVNNADRVLVKNQSFQDENGIYVASASSWTRATDADTWEELVGATCFITEGSTQLNTTWASNITAGGTLGVTPVTFVLFGSSASYTAGTGLTLVGSQFSLSTPVSVANGGSGVTTLTGLVKGNGASAFTAATGSDVVSLIGATAVQNATTAGSCSGNALTATTLQTPRTINGISFNGSANITINALTPYAVTFTNNGLGDIAGTAWNGNADRTISWNTIGAAATTGTNATGTWPISITGNAANVTSTVAVGNGGTGFASYATGDLLYASAPTTLSKLTAPSANDRVLVSSGASPGNIVPTWGQVQLNTTAVTGTLPTMRGGTGLASPFSTLGAVYANTSTTLTTGILPVSYGGTNADNATSAIWNLTNALNGRAASKVLAVNSSNTALEWINTQPSSTTLTQIAALSNADNNFIVGNGTSWVVESGSTARTSLGLGSIATTNYPAPNTTQFLRADGSWAAPASGGIYFNVTSYGASPAASGSTNRAAFQAAIDAALAAGRGTVYVPAGSYNIDNTLILSNVNLLGEGVASDIVATISTATAPIIYTAGVVSVRNLRIRYASGITGSETQGQKVAIKCGNISVLYGILQHSIFDYLQIENCGTAFYESGTLNLPNYGEAVFSTTFSNIWCFGFRYRGFDFNSTIRTGNVYQNIYLNTGAKDAFVSCNALFSLQGQETESSIIQLNIEHSQYTANAVIFDGCTGLGVTSMHIEGVRPDANSKAYVNCTHSSGSFNNLSLINCTHTRTSVPLIQLGSSYNNYWSVNGVSGDALTANYYEFGTLVVENMSLNSGCTVFSRGTNDGAMYANVGGFVYGPNGSAWQAFPISGNIEFISTGVNSNYNTPSRTFGGLTNFRNDLLTTAGAGATTAFYRPSTGSVAQFYIGSTASGQLYLPASGGTPAFYAGSDYRLKENVTVITDAVDRLKNVQAYTYNLIGESDTIEGFIAHELAAVCPDAVLGDKDAVDEDGNPIYQQVGPAMLIPVMAQAIKDLIGRIERLENNNG